MKGLLLKDWYTARKYCRFHFGLIAFMSVLSVFVDTGMMYMMYPLLFAAVIPSYILSVDEKFEWHRYGLTLPVSRRDMVTVKYIDALVSVSVTVVFITVLWLARFIIARNGSGAGPLLRMSAVLFCGGLLFPTLMLPAMMRFGVEKGRIIMIAAIVVAMLLVGLGISLSNAAPDGMEMTYMMDLAVRAGWRVPLLVIVMLALFGVSWFLAVRMFEKREL